MSFSNKTSLLFIFLISIYSCNNCQGCGDCIYENFEEKAIIKDIEYKNDSIYRVDFRSLNNKNEIFWIHDDELKNLVKDDSILETILKKDSSYSLKGQHITEGSCQPFIIKKISFSIN